MITHTIRYRPTNLDKMFFLKSHQFLFSTFKTKIPLDIIGIKLLIICTFSTINIVNTVKLDPNGYAYYFLTLPLLIFNLFFGIKYFSRFLELKKSSIGILIFILISSIIAWVRLDYSSIKVIFTDFLLIFLLFHMGKRNNISISFINKLFILQIFIGILTFYLGLNKYGFLPFQSDYGFWWRVSIFPYYTPPLTGAFAGLIFLINFIHYRRCTLLIIISFFYIIFSGSRTILLGVIISLLPFFLQKKITNCSLRVIIPYSFILLLSLFSFAVPFILQNVTNPFLQEFLFRDFFVLKQDSFSDVYRVTFIVEYWNAFSDNYLFGNGSFNLTEYAKLDIKGGDEVRLLNYLATFGIAFIGYIQFILKYQKDSEISLNRLKPTIIIYMLITLMLYGNFMRGYHFINQLIFVCIFFNLDSKDS